MDEDEIKYQLNIEAYTDSFTGGFMFNYCSICFLKNDRDIFLKYSIMINKENVNNEIHNS